MTTHPTDPTKPQQLAFWSEQVNAALFDYLLACEAEDAEALRKAYERAQLADRRWWQEANR